MDKSMLTVVATTYEATVGDYIYRLIEDKRGVLVKRIPAKEPNVWSHGVMSQMYDEDAGFVATILVKEMKYFKTVKDALRIIGGMK